MDVNVVILHCLIVQVMYSLSCSTGRVLLHTMQHVFFFICTSIQISILAFTEREDGSLDITVRK